MVSEVYEYGGCPDIIVDTIDDVKTGFVDEYSCMLQLSAYAHLDEEVNDSHGAWGRIIQIRDSDVKIYQYDGKTLENGFKDFLKLKDLYHSNNNFKRRI